MRCFIGIDLGSTTTKAVVMDEAQRVLGRGITNSRSNYDAAAAIAKQEALVNARFHLFRENLTESGALNGRLEDFLAQLERDFRFEQFLEQLDDLEGTCRRNAEGPRFGDSAAGVLACALPRAEEVVGGDPVADDEAHVPRLVAVVSGELHELARLIEAVGAGAEDQARQPRRGQLEVQRVAAQHVGHRLDVDAPVARVGRGRRTEQREADQRPHRALGWCCL